MSRLLPSPVCDLLGCREPIVLAGMGGVSRSELVAAVSAAGGFGFLGMVREDPSLIVAEVEALRRHGLERFGVNIIPAATDADLLEAQVAACIALQVPVVGTFWDLDARLVERLRRAGIVVVHQVGSLEEAIAAERAGVQIIIAQGREAGGHVRGTAPLRDLLPSVATSVRVPVLAAGGLATGSDLVTALALGAEGVVLGTVMIATHESFAHSYHKQRLLAAEAGDTVLTTDFHINWPPGAPVRVLHSAVTSGARGNPRDAERTDIGEENGRPIVLFSTDSPLRSMTGDFESMALYAGAGVGQVTEITGAGDRLRTILAEAQATLAIGLVDGPAESSSAVCYAGELTGAYMGHFSDSELAEELGGLEDDLRRALLAILATHVVQRPFVEDAVGMARAILMVRRVGTSLGGVQHPPGGSTMPTASELSLIRATILRRLRTILPRVPDRIGALSQVLALVEGNPPTGLRVAPPMAARRSTESHAASDQ